MELLKSSIYSIFAVLFLSSCSQQYDFGIPPSSDVFPSSVQYNNKVDMVFMVDDHSSMGYHHDRLAEAMPALVQSLLALKMDFHIVVVSSSMSPSKMRGGKFLGSPKVLTNATPNLGAVLGRRLQLGSDGSAREYGIESVMTVLSDKYLMSAEGQGFFREDALLSVIALSNEDDHSGIGTIADYTQFFEQRKKPFDNGQKSWVFNFIGNLEANPRCPTNPDQSYTERGDTFLALVNASHGQAESICSSDLTPAIKNIKARIVQVLTDFKLSRKPDISSIRVFSNGTPVPKSNIDGWDYLPAENLIRFYGSWIPAADVAIKINFNPAGAD